MEEDGVDPASINKNPRVLKSAIEDISKLDVLVCGQCLRVCHFIEEFKLHKITEPCNGSAQYIFEQVEREKRQGAVEQTWAFLLWKNAQHMKSSLSTLTLYQQWHRLSDELKEAWIIAGQTIQRFKNLSRARLQGVHSNDATLPINTVRTAPNKVGGGEGKENNETEPKRVVQQLLRRVVHNLPVNGSGAQRNDKQTTTTSSSTTTSAANSLPSRDVRTYVSPRVTPSTSRDPSTVGQSQNEETSVTMSPNQEEKLLREEFTNTGKIDEIEDEVDEKDPGFSSESKTENENTKEDVAGSEEGKMEVADDDSIEIKEENISDVDSRDEIVKRPPLMKKNTSQPMQNSNMLSRRTIKTETNNGGESSEDEYVVEKILAKRYNPRKKHFEYLLKWEGYAHDQNTWEPVQNMATCVELVATFERNLAKQRAAQEQLKKSVQQNNNSLSSSIQKQQVNKPEKLPPVKVEPAIPSSSNMISSSGRPVRNSKQRALGKMKTWCGSIGRDDDENEGKRKASTSSDSDDEKPVKKIKLEPEDDFEDYDGMDDSGNDSSGDDDRGRIWRQQSTTPLLVRKNKVGGLIMKSKPQIHTVVKKPQGGFRKILSKESMNSINGMSPESVHKNDGNHDLAVQLGLESPTKTRTSPVKPLQPPVLVANSKGVVKVDPCQLPNLTSGVYIVANKSPVDLPTKGKVVEVKQVHTISKTEPGSQRAATGQTGVVRKPLGHPTTGTKQSGQLGTESLKLPKSGLVLNPAAVRAGGPSLQKRPLLSRPGLQHMRPKLASPRLLGPRPNILGQRPNILGPRPKLLGPPRPKVLGPRPEQPSTPQSADSSSKVVSPRNQTPGSLPLAPRSSVATPSTRPSLPSSSARAGATPGIFRPSLGTLGVKRSQIGIPGVQTKITSAVKPRAPGQGLNKALSPLSAQTKSGVKSIQAMLGSAMAGLTPLTEVVAIKKVARFGTEPGKKDSTNTGMLQKQGLKLGKTNVKGRGHSLAVIQDKEGKSSKLADNDSLHMEFHQESSDSESEDDLSELPMGELPSLEPASPPRPFTLCPITGKILGKAEGERTPLPSPEPSEMEEVIPPEGESEEILPDQRDSSPLRVNEEEEMLLKVEMSPGGTTSKLVRDRGNVEEEEMYVDSLRTEQGLTVTKIADDTKNTQEMVRNVQVMKGPGGISVPATKLVLDSNNMNTELVTMGDGVVYQISTEDRKALEGGQHCVYVTTEQMEDGQEQNTGILTLNTAVAEAVAQMTVPERNSCSQFYVRESEPNDELVMATVVEATDPEGDPGTELVTHMVRQGDIIPGTRVILQTEDGNSVVYSQEVDEDDKDTNVVTHIIDGEMAQDLDKDNPEDVVHTDAQIVGGGDINPETGKRRVLLLLPNGQLMVTDVEEEIEEEPEPNAEKSALAQLLFPSKEFA